MMMRFRKEEKGQSLIEMAIVLPILIMLFLGIFEVARVGYAYLTISNATRSGARVASVGGLSSEIMQAIYDASPNLDPAKLVVSITPSTEYRKSGAKVYVEVKYPVQLITPIIEGVLPNPFIVQSKLTMRVE